MASEGASWGKDVRCKSKELTSLEGGEVHRESEDMLLSEGPRADLWGQGERHEAGR